MIDPTYSEKFENRHNAPDVAQIEAMLKTVKAKSVDDLISQTVPSAIRLKKPLNLPAAQSEYEFLNGFKKLVSKNKVFKLYIGTGYYNCITPGVILRNVLENPGWYTAYTPYQAEIAQGRMEALINSPEWRLPMHHFWMRLLPLLKLCIYSMLLASRRKKMQTNFSLIKILSLK